MNIKVLSILGLLVSTQAFGGWASGGGKIHRDSMNPWFLQNVKTVYYCIDIDEANFGVTHEVASKAIKWAFEQWEKGFAIAEDDYYSDGETLEPYGQLRIATQRFFEMSCELHMDFDLRFQLGTLTPQQMAVFDDPHDYVGVAFREKYDLERLRGRGFVYLAPTNGPLKPNLENLHPYAWSKHDNFALKHVLLHELGHIFGFAHRKQSVMDEMIPELIVNKGYLDFLNGENLSWMHHYLSTQRLFGFGTSWTQQGCGERNPIGDFAIFGLNYNDHKEGCAIVKLHDKRLQILWADDANAPYKPLAQADFFGAASHSSPAIGLYLPPEQKIFTKIPDEFLDNRIYGEHQNDSLEFTGNLKVLRTSQTFPIRINISIQGVDSTVIYDGKFRDDPIFLEN